MASLAVGESGSRAFRPHLRNMFLEAKWPWAKTASISRMRHFSGWFQSWCPRSRVSSRSSRVSAFSATEITGRGRQGCLKAQPDIWTIIPLVIFQFGARFVDPLRLCFRCPKLHSWDCCDPNIPQPSHSFDTWLDITSLPTSAPGAAAGAEVTFSNPWHGMSLPALPAAVRPLIFAWDARRWEMGWDGDAEVVWFLRGRCFKGKWPVAIPQGSATH